MEAENVSDKLELIPIGKGDKTKLILGTPETIDIKGEDDEGETTGTSGASFTKCTVLYTLSDGKGGAMLVEMPETFCFGVSKDFAYGKPKTEKNFKGYSFAYYYKDPKDDGKGKSKLGLDAANAEQKKSVQFWEQIQDVLSTHLEENVDLIPEKCGLLAKTRQLVSPIARYPKKDVVDPKTGKKKKVADKSKPMRSYFRLIQNKKSQTFVTKFYDEKDEEINPLDLIDVRGYIRPVVKVEWVYIGDATASFQVKLWEAVYKPQQAIQRERLLASSEARVPRPRNTTKASPSGKTSPSKNPNDELGGDEGVTEDGDSEEKPKLVKKRPPVKNVKQKPKKVTGKKVEAIPDVDDESFEL